jgi:hypothetical protein
MSKNLGDSAQAGAEGSELGLLAWVIAAAVKAALVAAGIGGDRIEARVALGDKGTRGPAFHPREALVEQKPVS